MTRTKHCKTISLNLISGQSDFLGLYQCTHERTLWTAGYEYVAGIDEVGRGALAGPVTAAAVVFHPNSNLETLRNVRDSKKLTAKERVRLDIEIKKSSMTWGIGWASAKEVDDVGIVPATALAMDRAVLQLSPKPDYFLVDGNRPLLSYGPTEAIVHGDALVMSISAASIVAKVARDAWMEQLSHKFLDYGFVTNKGYGTSAHLKALTESGPSPEHRRSFAPLRNRSDRTHA